MSSSSSAAPTGAAANFGAHNSNPNYFGADTLAWDSYHQVRPSYPASLFDVVFTHHEKHNSSNDDAAWQLAADFGSGPGTIVEPLLQRFARVEGSDLNERQVNIGRGVLQQRFGEKRVAMHVGAAGACDWIQDGTADLITAAEAAQWFDAPAWIAEAGRKLKPNGTLAFWYYSPNCTIVSHPKASPLCNKLFSILFESVWSGEGFPRGAVEAHALKLRNIAIDSQLFTDETRHYWDLPSKVAGPHGLGENAPSSFELVKDSPTHVGKAATEVQHPAEEEKTQRCYLESKPWTTSELLRYIESLGMPMSVLYDHPDYKPTLDALHSEVGGEQGTFNVGWWLALVMATRK